MNLKYLKTLESFLSEETPEPLQKRRNVSMVQILPGDHKLETSLDMDDNIEIEKEEAKNSSKEGFGKENEEE